MTAPAGTERDAVVRRILVEQLTAVCTPRDLAHTVPALLAQLDPHLLPSRPSAAAFRVTDRQMEVLRHIACGLTNAAIGHELGVVEETVKSRVRQMLRQSGARAHLVARAYEAGLLGRAAKTVTR